MGSGLSSYPVPVRVAVVKERLKIVLQPLIVIVFDILTKSLNKLILWNIIRNFPVSFFKLPV
ncbi:MAG: hypothetical protein A2Z76_03955 [Chloroflexi bacterium RBG_13_56_8b]|nr:MAG: hypothetical protein A2Z76_03955 [Chloroflexi bacterium RBG_13_56_8b]